MKLILSLFIVLLTGCGVARIPSKITLDDRLPSAEATKVISTLNQQAAKISSGRFLFETTVSHSLGKEKLKQAVVFQRPDLVRVEFFQPGINQTASLIVTNGDSLQAYNIQDKSIAVGKPSVANFKKLLHVPFLPEEMVLWLSGTFLPLAPGTAYRVHNSSEGVALWIYTPDKRTVLCHFTQSGEKLRLNALEIYINDSAQRVFRSDLFYSNKDTPDSIKFWLAEQDIAGEMVVDTMTMNPDISALKDRLFNIHLRSGMKVKDL